MGWKKTLKRAGAAVSTGGLSELGNTQGGQNFLDGTVFRAGG